jgi:mono/diheme cytochrome c family protein
MRIALSAMLLTVCGAALVFAIVWFGVMPRLDWGARQPPGPLESALARRVVFAWVRSHAGSETNPLAETPENLRSAEDEYTEHCAACHGLDGGGRNRFEADFRPPVPKLTGDLQNLSDGEIKFIILNGIGNTAMPAFGALHSGDDIWRCALWMRHLGHLTDSEKAEIESRMLQDTDEHEQIMHMMPDSRGDSMHR